MVQDLIQMLRRDSCMTGTQLPTQDLPAGIDRNECASPSSACRDDESGGVGGVVTSGMPAQMGLGG